MCASQLQLHQVNGPHRGAPGASLCVVDTMAALEEVEQLAFMMTPPRSSGHPYTPSPSSGVGPKGLPRKSSFMGRGDGGAGAGAGAGAGPGPRPVGHPASTRSPLVPVPGSSARAAPPLPRAAPAAVEPGGDGDEADPFGAIPRVD